MITHISIASVFVTDVDESKAFYIDVLGFVENSDVTLSDGYRWCTVSHPNQPELMVHLTVPGPPHTSLSAGSSAPRTCSGPPTSP